MLEDSFRIAKIASITTKMVAYWAMLCVTCVAKELQNCETVSMKHC